MIINQKSGNDYQWEFNNYDDDDDDDDKDDND